MPPEDRGAQTYFDRIPRRWDAIYAHESPLRYRVNRLLRPGIFRRHALAFSEAGDLTGKSVLDVGCGTGRFAIECARRGAARVVGVDFAPQMVRFCRDTARRQGVSDRAEFVCADVLRHRFHETFDVVLALGLFDYVKESDPLFKAIAALEPSVFVASFPRFKPLWSTQRYLRYYLVRRCPVYDYSEAMLHRLFEEAPFASHRVEKHKTGYLAVGYGGKTS